MPKTILQNITIIDKNGTLLFDQNSKSEKSIVNKEEVQVVNYTDQDLKIQIRNIEAKDDKVSITVDNIYKCPLALWKKLSGVQKIKYNEGMKRLNIGDDLWFMANGKVCEEKVIAHNALILLADIL